MLKRNNLLYGFPVDGPWLAAKSLTGLSLIHSMQHRVQTLFFPLPDCSILRTCCLLAVSRTDYIYLYIFICIYIMHVEFWHLCVSEQYTNIWLHLSLCKVALVWMLPEAVIVWDMWNMGKKALSSILKEHCPRHWWRGEWIQPQCKAIAVSNLPISVRLLWSSSSVICEQFHFMLPVTSYFHNILMNSIPNINDNNTNKNKNNCHWKVFPYLFIQHLYQHLSPVIVSWQEITENEERTNLFPEFGNGVSVFTPGRLSEGQKVKQRSLELKFKSSWHGPKENCATGVDTLHMPSSGRGVHLPSLQGCYKMWPRDPIELKCGEPSYSRHGRTHSEINVGWASLSNKHLEAKILLMVPHMQTVHFNEHKLLAD